MKKEKKAYIFGKIFGTFFIISVIVSITNRTFSNGNLFEISGAIIGFPLIATFVWIGLIKIIQLFKSKR